MLKPVLELEAKFNLMVEYQRTIESQSIISNHSPQDQCAYGLYTLEQPIPSFEEYVEGNEFSEGILIAESSDIVQIMGMQDERRVAACN